MSVIAKVSIAEVTPFGTGNMVRLSCIAANETMLFASPSEEDKLFTQASPSGEIKLMQPASRLLGAAPTGPDWRGAQFYVIVLFGDEAEPAKASGFDGAYAWTQANLTSITDYGGTTKHVEFTEGRANHQRDQVAGKGIDRMNWKMGVDNPGAYNQFKAGATDLHVAFYPCANFDYHGALHAALTGAIKPAVAEGA